MDDLLSLHFLDFVQIKTIFSPDLYLVLLNVYTSWQMVYRENTQKTGFVHVKLK